MESKICRACGLTKDLTEYCKVTKNKDGYNHFCKSCRNKKDKIYRTANKLKVSEKFKKYNANPENKLKRSQYAKEFRLKNLESMRKKALEKQKLKRLDPLYKFKEAIRNRIRKAISYCGQGKKSKTSEILGCSFDEFKLYIESLWSDPKNLDENGNIWMNWNNRGLYNGTPNYGWDIDHIIPVSSTTCKVKIIELNHYTNLQPLCSYVNRHIKRNL